MIKFEVICSACMAKVAALEKYEQEICPICGFNVDAYIVKEESE